MFTLKALGYRPSFRRKTHSLILCLSAVFLACGGVPPTDPMADIDKQLDDSHQKLFGDSPASGSSDNARSRRTPDQGNSATATSRNRTRLQAKDLKYGIRGARCAPLNGSDDAAKSEALAEAARKADGAISEQIWSSISTNMASSTEGQEANNKLSVKRLSKRQTSVKSFMGKSGRALVVTLPGSDKCTRKKCCVVRVLPTDDAVASVNRRLTLTLEEFRGYAEQALENEEGLRAYFPKVKKHYNEALQQLLRRRAIDRTSAIRLSDRDESLWRKVQRQSVATKTKVKLAYTVKRHPKTGNNRMAKRVVQNIFNRLGMSVPKRFYPSINCRSGRTHVVVLDIDELETKKSSFVGEMCFVSAPMEVRLLKCPRGDEMASESVPEKFTREETSFSCDHTEKLLWKGLTGKKIGKKLGQFMRDFLSQHLGL